MTPFSGQERYWEGGGGSEVERLEGRRPSAGKVLKGGAESREKRKKNCQTKQRKKGQLISRRVKHTCHKGDANKEKVDQVRRTGGSGATECHEGLWNGKVHGKVGGLAVKRGEKNRCKAKGYCWEERSPHEGSNASRAEASQKRE